MFKPYYGKFFWMLFSIALSGCDLSIASAFGGIKGSGVVASQAREMNAFTEISLESTADVNIIIGSAQRVVISADDYLLGAITTEVTNGRLSIGSKERYSSKVRVVVDVTVPKLMMTYITGSGSISIQGLSGAQFTAKIMGSGDIEASGVVGDLDISITGSGDVNFERVIAKRAKAYIAGSGNVIIHATTSLHAKVSGSGDIRYVGSPKIDFNISGSGSITSMK